MKKIGAFFRNALCGTVALIAVHLVSAFSGVGLGFGWLTLGVSILFGVPGVAMLMLLNIIL